MKMIFLQLFIFLVACFFVKAQTKDIARINIVQGDANACELNRAHYDILADAMRDNDERLFVIARLGKGEVSSNFNRRRLHNVRAYFKNWMADPKWKVYSKRFVFAEGENLKTEEGRIEFYLGSKLQLVSLVKRNRDICVTCCNFDDPKYYGMGKTDKPKRRNK